MAVTCCVHLYPIIQDTVHYGEGGWALMRIHHEAQKVTKFALFTDACERHAMERWSLTSVKC